MEEKTKLQIMFYFTILYLLFFTMEAILKKNFEFLYYTFIISILISIIVFYHKKMHMTYNVMLGLVILGILHMSGGNLHFGGTRLYDIWIINGIYKFDNFVHMVGAFVAKLVMYSMLYPHLDKEIEHNKILLSFLLILLASGLGALNEISELIAVVFFNAAAQVGDYMNNIFDLVFNLLGSILACIYLMYYHHKIHNKK